MIQDKVECKRERERKKENTNVTELKKKWKEERVNITYGWKRERKKGNGGLEFCCEWRKSMCTSNAGKMNQMAARSVD